MKNSFIVSVFFCLFFSSHLDCAESLRAKIINVKSKSIEDLLSHVTKKTLLIYDIDEVLFTGDGEFPTLVEGQTTKTTFNVTKARAHSVVGITARSLHSRKKPGKNYYIANCTQKRLAHFSLHFPHTVKNTSRVDYLDFFTHKNENGTENLAQSVGYHNGVVYTSGTVSKAVACLFLHERIKEEEWADEIVMIDDQEKNLNEMLYFFMLPLSSLDKIFLRAFSSNGCNLIALYAKLKEKIKKVTLIQYNFEKDPQVLSIQTDGQVVSASDTHSSRVQFIPEKEGCCVVS